jgi:hypothetical protein
MNPGQPFKSATTMEVQINTAHFERMAHIRTGGSQGRAVESLQVFVKDLLAIFRRGAVPKRQQYSSPGVHAHTVNTCTVARAKQFRHTNGIVLSQVEPKHMQQKNGNPQNKPETKTQVVRSFAWNNANLVQPHQKHDKLRARIRNQGKVAVIPEDPMERGAKGADTAHTRSDG